MVKMKTLTINGQKYIVMDAEAWEQIGDLDTLATENKENLVAAVNEVFSKNVDAGADGGYYTLSVDQMDENTVRVSFTPSKEGMPAVENQEITLPAGADGYTPVKGVDYFDGEPGTMIHLVNTSVKLTGDPVLVLGSYVNAPKVNDLVLTTEFMLYTITGIDEEAGTVEVLLMGSLKPEKGTDYFTEEDKTEIVNDVLAALPDGDEVSY